MESNEAPKKFPLKREEAEFRKSELTDKNGNYHVEYNYILVLRKSTDLNANYEKNNFEGRLHMKFAYFGKVDSDLFLNFSGDVHSIIVNGQLQETHYQERRIYLPRSKLKINTDANDKDNLNDVVILFSGRYDKGGVGLHHFVDPIDKREYLYTQFEPYECHLAFPVFDQPDIKATMELTLLGPHDWVLLSNENEKWVKELNLQNNDVKTLLDTTLNHDEQKFLLDAVLGLKYNISPFNRTSKISSYLYAICAGPYFCITDKTNYVVPLRLFMRESLKNCGEPDEFFRVTIAGMEWYKNYFGLAYPFNKYDQIFTPEYNFGAMENVGLVTYNEAYCWKDVPSQQKRARFCITVLHELAHMWFGNLVTMKWWDDLWLNESFATFISFLCQNQAVPEEYPTSWLSFNSHKGIAYREDQKATTHPVMGDITDTDKAQSHFDAIVYYKGSSLLKQMFYFVGMENFSKGLKSYFKTYAWSNTIFEDFVGKMSEALKENQNETNFDLQSLSKDWIMKSGLNQIEATWEEADGKLTSFHITQTPCLNDHPNLQIHMIDMLFVYDTENQVHKNILVSASHSTSVASVVGEIVPKAVVLNYNDWGYAKWVIDKKSLDYFKDHLTSRIPDILTRQLFYRSLFDLARDAKISTPEYLDVILKLIEHETNDEILTTTLRYISGLISNYVPLKYYQYYSTQMFALVGKLLAKNIDNKEIVLNFVELMIVFAYSEDNINLLRNWLVDGPYVTSIHGEKIQIPPNLLSQDNRFSILTLLYRSRTIPLEEKEKLLEAEVQRDGNSDRSVRARLRLKAALPDKDIKNELWTKFIDMPTSDSLYNMKAYMSGFTSIDQLDLVENLINQRFYEDAVKIANQEYFYVDAFVACCGPVYYASEDTINKLEVLAEKTKSFDIMKRRILELADDIRRFLKAQELAEVYLSNLSV